jgi:beta-lactamase class A
MTTAGISRLLRATFDDAGVQGWLHVRALSASGADVALAADEPVALSSVYKLPLLVAFVRMVDAGEIDPTRRVTVPATPRTAGSTGLSIMRDPVTMSWRDLAVQMITVSDNSAADVLLRKVGLERVTMTLRALGLDATTVTRGSAEEIAGLMTETGAHSVAEAFAALADLDHVATPSGYDPLRASASTARDMTTLLTALWTGQAASPEQTEFAKTVLAQRVGPYRLRAGFPHDAIAVADKTGTLGALRHDVGMVEFPDGDAYAVAVFTRAARPDRLLPGVDAVIGQAARLAVDALRS